VSRNVKKHGALSVVTLPEREPPADVIALLEDLLARTKAGEIAGVGISASCTDRGTLTAYALGDAEVPVLVTACERLKLRLLEE